LNVADDFLELLKALAGRGAEFVIVGGYALAFHGHPRYTGDLDIWIRPSPENAERVLQALSDFGFGSLGLSAADLLSGKVVQLGRAPVRVDFLTELDGVSAAELWTGRASGTYGGLPVFFISRESLLRNKKAVGRPQDLLDVETLQKLPPPRDRK